MALYGWTKARVDEYRQLVQTVAGLARDMAALRTLVNARLGGKSDPMPPITIPVRTRSAVSGSSGRFNARTIARAYSSTATGALTEANIGTAAGTDDILAWDLDAIKGCRVAIPVSYSYGDSKTIYVLIPRGVFPVKLTQTGGSAGNKTTAVSFTYTVNDLNDQQITTAHTPTWPSRGENGLKVAATEGLAWWDGSALKVFAFERAGTGSC